jgi:hypothetical protein
MNCCTACDGEGFRHDDAGPMFDGSGRNMILNSYAHDCPECGGTGEKEDE